MAKKNNTTEVEPMLDKRETNDKLDAANATITNLEADLKHSHGENDKLKAEIDNNIQTIDQANQALGVANARIEELEIENAKLKEAGPKTTKETVTPLTNGGRFEEVVTTDGFVDLQNQHGAVIARHVTVEEAYSRMKKNPNISVIQPEGAPEPKAGAPIINETENDHVEEK
jgi:chromosome segregation ATPase